MTSIANEAVSNLSNFNPTNIVFDKPSENTYGMIIPIKKFDGKYNVPLIIASPEVKYDVPESW